jgi:mono/diheme cytochrome c family protein
MKTWVLAVIAVAVVLVMPELVSAEAELIGSDEYQRSCLTCHGVGGRGDGPMAQYLTVKPADLTQLTKNNDGLFPIIEIYQIIDGTTLVPTHGERAMPVWGARYLEEDGGNYGPLTGEQGVRLRILELLFYIQSIQQ